MRSLGTLQRLVSVLGTAPNERLAASIIGTGGCRPRGLASTAAAGQGKPEYIPDAFDQEFDRSDDVMFAQMRDQEEEERMRVRREEGLKCPVDLETEFDRDAPDAVDPAEVWREEAAMEPLGRPVDLETEFDRDDPDMADKSHLWDTPEVPQPADIESEFDLMSDREEEPRAYAGMEEPKQTVPSESPGGTMAGNAPFGQERKAS